MSPFERSVLIVCPTACEGLSTASAGRKDTGSSRTARSIFSITCPAGRSLVSTTTWAFDSGWSSRIARMNTTAATSNGMYFFIPRLL